jgi:hypothetical protein
VSTRKNLAHAARLAKRRASLTVAPGEHLIEHYCHDATECQCAPTGNCGGVPTCPSVGARPATGVSSAAPCGR